MIFDLKTSKKALIIKFLPVFGLLFSIVLASCEPVDSSSLTDTSTTTDISTSESFGFQLLDVMTRQLHGEIKALQDKGTKFVIEFNL
ncbi:MAG TPA: hypothetical protein PKL57_19460 [Candidatus Wallbacteria bacterium]|nr:hypothetical protein [Candidatus Wallbacteria bacterium]